MSRISLFLVFTIFAFVACASSTPTESAAETEVLLESTEDSEEVPSKEEEDTSLMEPESTQTEREAAQDNPLSGLRATATTATKTVGNGQTTVVRVALEGTEQKPDLQIDMGQKVIPLHPCPADGDKNYCALVSIPLEHEPGKISAKILAVAPLTGDKTEVGELELTVRDIKYPFEKLRVSKSKVQLDKKSQARVSEEQQILAGVLEKVSTEPRPLRSFNNPVQSKVTSRFGKKRLFNGQLRSFHTGTDFRAGPKTAIRASNDGIVILNKNLFFAGNVVMLDHGWGVTTSYAHLSRITVKEGQPVKRGDKVGYAGSTGRVTAPHLHYTVRVHGETIDPVQFTQVATHLWPPPKTKAKRPKKKRPPVAKAKKKSKS